MAIQKGDINPATGICQWCGRKFVIASNHKSRGQKYCSRMCFWKDKVGKIMRNKGRPLSKEHRLKLSGSNANNWQGGITKENELFRKRVEFRLWRESVFSRDNWTCQKCGKRGEELEPHHIKAFSLYPELRFAIDNGLTLCKKCHKETDNYGGRTNKYAR